MPATADSSAIGLASAAGRKKNAPQPIFKNYSNPGQLMGGVELGGVGNSAQQPGYMKSVRDHTDKSGLIAYRGDLAIGEINRAISIKYCHFLVERIPRTVQIRYRRGTPYV